MSFVLSGCSSKVEEVMYAPIIVVPQDRKAAPADLRQINFDIPVGAIAGETSEGSRYCGWPYVPPNRQDLESAFNTKELRNAFDLRMEALGYDIVGGREIIFDDEQTDEALRTEYLIGARIKDIQVNMCSSENYSLFFVFNRNPGVEGALQMTVQWSVYDRIRQRSVFKTTTKGYAELEKPNREGLMLLMNNAFAMAAHNLGNQTQFRDVMYFNLKPDDLEKKYKHDHRVRPRHFQSDEAVHLNGATKMNGLFQDHVETIQKSVVIIQAGKGHGSGFIISKNGHVLTNSHVVGNAMYVRLETPHNKQSLRAEVLRRNTERDVALLRIIDMPMDFESYPLVLAQSPPVISEDVYAIGAPVRKSYSETVTKGIISSFRRPLLNEFGRRQNFIQADVTIVGGSSGGPLFNKHGEVLGIAVGGYSFDGGDTGLNLFIPIDEALKILNITFNDQDRQTQHIDQDDIDQDGRPTIIQPPQNLNKTEQDQQASAFGYFEPRGFNIQFQSLLTQDTQENSGEQDPNSPIMHQISIHK